MISEDIYKCGCHVVLITANEESWNGLISSWARLKPITVCEEHKGFFAEKPDLTEDFS